MYECTIWGTRANPNQSIITHILFYAMPWKILISDQLSLTMVKFKWIIVDETQC